MELADGKVVARNRHYPAGIDYTNVLKGMKQAYIPETYPDSIVYQYTLLLCQGKMELDEAVTKIMDETAMFFAEQQYTLKAYSRWEYIPGGCKLLFTVLPHNKQPKKQNINPDIISDILLNTPAYATLRQNSCYKACPTCYTILTARVYIPIAAQLYYMMNGGCFFDTPKKISFILINENPVHLY